VAFGKRVDVNETKASADRELSIVEGIRSELGRKFVREVDGVAVQRWYENVTGIHGLAANTTVRHFNVMHHMMEKASTLLFRPHVPIM
jgi:hypothetical protein